MSPGKRRENRGTGEGPDDVRTKESLEAAMIYGPMRDLDRTKWRQNEVAVSIFYSCKGKVRPEE